MPLQLHRYYEVDLDRDEKDIAVRRWMRVSFTLIILGFLVGLSKIRELQDGVPANHYDRAMEHLHVAYVFILVGTIIACFVSFRGLFQRATFSFLPDFVEKSSKEISNTLHTVQELSLIHI